MTVPVSSRLEVLSPLVEPKTENPPPQTKPSDLVEASEARLQADFKAAQTNLDRAGLFLKTAQAVKREEEDSIERWLIAERRQKGEPIDGIIEKSAARVRDLRAASLDRELPLRKEEVSRLRGEVGSPATDKDILRVVIKLKDQQTPEPDDPALAEVKMRQQAGKSLAEIKAQAEEAIAGRKRASKILKMAEENMKYRREGPLDEDIRRTIEDRMRVGESLDAIIEKTRTNLNRYAEDDKKRGQLAQALERIGKIENEKQAIASEKQKERELTTSQRLREVRQELGSI